MEPKFEVPYKGLTNALQDMQMWQKRAEEANTLLRVMLKTRQSIAEVAGKFDIRYACPD